jgi:alpha-methylacyl-CoA racemase
VTGPLQNLRIIEFGSLGPGPFACMMLADHGAEVIRIIRTRRTPTDDLTDVTKDALARSRKVVPLDLTDAASVEKAKQLIRTADGLVEGYRPGVMERLGLGPEVLLPENPRLVYGRMTGWGQDGPLARNAGHDINYIALSGALHAIGRQGQPPVPPANLVGDFGGGGMVMAFGMVSAILHARQTGVGQIVDCSMLDGSALLMALLYSAHEMGTWRDDYGVNMIDGGSHFYDAYGTADGKFVSIGAIEPQFYKSFLQCLGISDDPSFHDQYNPENWLALKGKVEAIFKTKTRQEWCEIFDGHDACFAPVLSMREAPNHPHNIARGTFIDVGGLTQPAPAPRYSVTRNDHPRRMAPNQNNTAEFL